MGCSVVCCKSKGGSLCCAIFSLSGVTFMLYIKTLLSLQPRYIHGITSDIHNGSTKSDNEIASGNTTAVAILYTVTMLISTASYFYHTRQEAANGRFGSRSGRGRAEVELEELDLSSPLIPPAPRSLSSSPEHADVAHPSNRHDDDSTRGGGITEMTFTGEQGVRMAELVRRNVDVDSTASATPPAAASEDTGSEASSDAAPVAESSNVLDLS